jgi:eukaryotic-like serine/threonine-protein kinase
MNQAWWTRKSGIFSPLFPVDAVTFRGFPCLYLIEAHTSSFSRGHAMTPALLCPTCGKTVPVDAPGEVCPACLMKLAFDGQVTSAGRTLPPSSREAAVDTVGYASEPSIRENRAPLGDAIRIPGYECLEELGRGGMGVVYKARHLALKRLVALKMIVGADYASADQIERFRREAEAVARLQHPNIVQIYEVGQRDGRPYFSLEFVDGGSLADKLRGTPLPPAEAARVVEILARAVHAAHQRGIVHRDLKPGNVLLTADGTPKIADFGLAKETDGSSSRTQEGTVVGTPSYMAPEQAGGKVNAIGPAADTYALGAILYETLTGRPPFKGVTSLDTIMQVVSLEPAPPRDLQSQVPRDLETICLKCLHKNPARRYASAVELAEDLRRFQAFEPIQARPTSTLERMRKWSRRHPAATGLSAALVLVVAAAFSLVTWKWQEADRAAGLDREAKVQAERVAKLDRDAKEQADNLAQEANKRAEAEKLAADTERKRREEVALALENRQQISFTSQVWRAAGLINTDPVLALRTLEDPQLCPPERRDFPWHYQYQLGQRLVRRLAYQHGDIRDGALSPDCKVLATRTANGKIRLWEFATGEPGLLLDADHGGGDNVNDRTIGDGVVILFSPDNQTLATGGVDGLVKLWDVKTGRLKTTLQWQIPDGRPRHVAALAFHPDGKTLAVGGHIHDKERQKQFGTNQRFRYLVVWVWDLASGAGKLLATHTDLKAFNDVTHLGHLLYSPDGKFLAVGGGAAVLMLDPASGKQLQRYWVESGWPSGMGFSPDGKQFAYGNSSGNLFLCDTVAEKIRPTLYGHIELVTPGGTFGVHDCKFTTDGALVTAGYDGTIRIWDTGSGQMRAILRSPYAVGDRKDSDRIRNRILRLFLLPGGRELLAVTPREVQVWSMQVSAPAVSVQFKRPMRGPSPSTVAFDDSSSRFAVAGPDDRVQLYRLTRQTYAGRKDDKVDAGLARFTRVTAELDSVLKGHKGKITAVAFGPTRSNLIVSGGEDGLIRVWQANKQKDAPPRVLSGHTKPLTCLAVSPDGKYIVSASRDGTLRRWDMATGQSSQPFADDNQGFTTFALSRDGKRLVTGDKAGSVRIWDFETHTLLKTVSKAVPGPIEQISLTPDGKVAATVSLGVVAVHDLTTGLRLRFIISEKLARVALSPDGKTLAVPGPNDRLVRLYDVVSGHLRGELPVLSHNVFGLGFNHDGTVLATISLGQPDWDDAGEIKLWAAATPAATK